MRTSRLHIQRSALDPRQRLCVELSARYARGERDEAARLMQRSLNRGVCQPRFLAELFIHLSLLIGFPNMLDGLEKLASLRRPSRRATASKRDVATIRRRGERTLRRVYGKQAAKLLASFSALHPDVPRMIVHDVYGRVIARPGLSLAERELVNIAVLTIQCLHRQLYSHLRGALRVGVPMNTLRRVLQLLNTKFGVRIEHASASLSRLEQLAKSN